MIEFPRFIFKNGVQKLVKSQLEYDAHIESGWFSTIFEVPDPKPEPVFEENEFEDVGAEIVEPETMAARITEPAEIDPLRRRATLESKAKELGLKFDGRYSDKRLSQMIESAEK